MKKLKVLLASMTALCLLAGNLPVVKQVMPFTIYASAKDTEEFATSGTCGENLTWNFEKSTGTLTISGTGAMEDWYYTSPGWYNLCKTIKKVIIEDGVTTIGVGAFWECSALESIIIPDSVTRIESGTFIDTPWLERKRKENPLVIINGILIDGKTCKQKKITIPDGVKTIGNYAFDDCNALESITIPDSVTVIKANAFSDCSALESIVIPDSVTTIEACAFYNCFALESIVIPDSVTTIGGDAFKRTQWLKDKIEENPLVIVNGILINGQTCEKKIIIPENVTTIAEYAFYGCESLTSVTIPNSVTSIEKSAFSSCSALESITIPDSVTIIKASTFNYCESLKSILIPNSVTIIEDWAFSYCFALESITIPNSVTTIGESAFCSCSALKSITIPNSVTSIKFLAFDCKNLETIKIENPECEIEDYENCTIFDRATIYGYDNSTAQAYAEKYDREFVSLGEAPVYEIGDINRDGAINVTDIIYLQKYLHGKQNISQRQYALADMNQDNMINIFDFVLLKNKILNKK